jgi:hypothetical protein
MEIRGLSKREKEIIEFCLEFAKSNLLDVQKFFSVTEVELQNLIERISVN